MTDPNNTTPPVGETPPPGGSGGGGGGGGQGDKPETVAYETHRKLLNEKKKADERLAQLEAEKAERERKEAEAKGEYQKLLELERERAAKLEADLKARDEQEAGRRKLAAVLSAAGGTIESKFFGLIPYDEVVIDPQTGEIDKLSVTKAVEKVKRDYPEIIKAQGGPRTPNEAPGANGQPPKSIKRSEWKKLPSKEMKKWVGHIIDD